MAKEFTGNFYQSKAWRDCRSSFIAIRVSIDGGKCEHCSSAGKKVYYEARVFI